MGTDSSVTAFRSWDSHTHWYLLVTKQPQKNLSSSPSPLDSSSYPHNSYLSSRVAISTTTSKLVPSVPLFSYFFIRCFPSVEFLILTYFSLDFHLYTTILHSFYSASVLSILSIPSFLYQSLPFIPKLPFHALWISVTQLLFSLEEILLFFKEHLPSQGWRAVLQQTACQTWRDCVTQSPHLWVIYSCFTAVGR